MQMLWWQKEKTVKTKGTNYKREIRENKQKSNLLLGGNVMSLEKLRDARKELNVSIDTMEKSESRKNKLTKFIEVFSSLKDQQRVQISIQGAQIDLYATDKVSNAVVYELTKEVEALDKQIRNDTKAIIRDVKDKVDDINQALKNEKV